MHHRHATKTGATVAFRKFYVDVAAAQHRPLAIQPIPGFTTRLV
jgi:hypothetical protein